MATNWLGIILAITASIANNLGIVLQKKAVNEVPAEAREDGFFRTLAMRPLWLLGLFLQMGVSAAFMLSAQYLVGPTLVPGLQGLGLIVLALASVRMNDETLSTPEYLGIALLIIATTLTAFSGLHIEVSHFDFSQGWFFRNAVAYTGAILVLILLLEVGQRRSGLYVKSMLLTIISGFLYALSDFWISPLVGTIGTVFQLQANWAQWSLFIIACVLLVSANLLGIGKTQVAFKYGPASILIPIRHIPTLTLPVVVYTQVYSSTAPGAHSLPFFLTSVVLIVISSYLLGRQEARFGDGEN